MILHKLTSATAKNPPTVLDNYFIGIFDNSDNYNSAIVGISTDADNNIYTSGYTSLVGSTSNRYPIHQKYNSAGLLEKEIIEYSTTNDTYGASYIRDSLGNTYTVSTIYDISGTNTGSYSVNVVKYNTNDTVVWSKKYYRSYTTSSTSVMPKAVLSSDESYIYIGLHGWGGTSSWYQHSGVLKISTETGTITSMAQGYDYYSANYSGHMAFTSNPLIDSDNNVYAVSSLSAAGQSFIEYPTYLAKINAGGTSTLWSIKFAKTSNYYPSYIRGMGHNLNSLYIYAVVNVSSTGNVLYKISKATGSIIWQKIVNKSNSSNSLNVISIAVDSSDNIYLWGYSNSISAGIASPTLIKIDTNASVVYAREFTGGTGIDTFSSYTPTQSVSIDSSDNILVCGSIKDGQTKYISFFAKLPSDGSGLGSYNALNFASLNYVEIDPTLITLTTPTDVAINSGGGYTGNVLSSVDTSSVYHYFPRRFYAIS